MTEKTKSQNKESSAQTMRNSNKWDTRTLVIMALLCAVSVLLSFLELPIFPAAPFLKYDASAVPAMLSGFSFGPAAGVAVGIVSALVHGLMVGDFPGMLMNMLVVLGFVLPAALVYRKSQSTKAAIVGLVLSIVFALLLAIAGNLIITPMYMGAPLESVIAMIIPILVPFNLLKGVLNAALTMLALKTLGGMLAPKKKASGKKPARTSDAEV